MNRGDALWGAGLALVTFVLAYPPSHAAVIALTRDHPYAMGFLKFAILATMGEVLSIRLVAGRWTAPHGVPWRVLVWGLLGAALALVFPVFAAGVRGALDAGLLPLPGGAAGARVGTALWISVVMNLAFAPTMMLGHRLTDTWLDLAGGRIGRVASVPLAAVVAAIDWRGFVGFVLVRTIPLFWIPAHTVTFLVPAELRVICAAYLSLALGAILAFAKRRRGA